MIVLGVILLIIGFLVSIPILWTIGIVLVVAGLLLALLGSTGRMIERPASLFLNHHLATADKGARRRAGVR